MLTGNVNIKLDMIEDGSSNDALRNSLIDVAHIAAYDAASPDEWIAISKAEYDKINANLLSVSTIGFADGNMKTGTFGNFQGGDYLTDGLSGGQSPANTYVYAFALPTTTLGTFNNDLVRLSTTGDGTGLNQYGNILPEGIVDDQVQHWLLKTPTILQVSPVYLGCTAGHGGAVYHSGVGVSGRFTLGSTTTVTTSGTWNMQAKGTTQKQWP